MKNFKKYIKGTALFGLILFFQRQEAHAMNKPVPVQKMTTFGGKPLPSEQPMTTTQKQTQSSEPKIGLLDKAKESLTGTKQTVKDSWKQSAIRTTLKDYSEGKQIKKEVETHEKTFAQLQKETLDKQKKIATLEKQVQEKSKELASKPVSKLKEEEQLGKIITLQDKLALAKKDQESRDQQLQDVQKKLAQSKETAEAFKNLKGKIKDTQLTDSSLKEKKVVDVETLLKEKRKKLEETKKQVELEAEKNKKTTTMTTGNIPEGYKLSKEESSTQKVKSGMLSGAGSGAARIAIMAVAAPLLALLTGGGIMEANKISKQGVDAGINTLNSGGSADTALSQATQAMLNESTGGSISGITQTAQKDSPNKEDDGGIPFITPPDEQPVKVAVRPEVKEKAKEALSITNEIKKKAEIFVVQKNEEAKKLLVATADAQKNATQENKDNLEETKQKTQEALIKKMEADATQKLADQAHLLVEKLSQS